MVAIISNGRYRISQGREHVVMPMIDGIDKQWNYKPGGVELIGFNTKLVK
jgi:hypothetical protein